MAPQYIFVNLKNLQIKWRENDRIIIGGCKLNNKLIGNQYAHLKLRNDLPQFTYQIYLILIF